jgi:DNA mismatch repair protein MutL
MPGEPRPGEPSETVEPLLDGRRLPQASFEPLESRPVPLSGRGGREQSYRLLGQYKGTMILLEGSDGLYLIDQHVAHERILYERIRRNLAADAPQVQRLLEPHLIELSRAELMRVEPLLDPLEACGIEAAPVSPSTLGLTAVPLDMTLAQVEAAIQSLARRDEDDEESPADLRRRLLEDGAASMSCRAAVKMHHVLTREEMEHLLGELFDAEQPYACPHGRPVIMKLSDVDLERGFKRR